MKQKVITFLEKPRSLAIIFFLFALGAALQSYFGSVGTVEYQGMVFPMTSYNNYVIFERSFFHLLDGEDLYKFFPAEHWDLFKYTPTFSLLFGFFAMFPTWLGMILWNLVNAFLLLYGVYLLSRETSLQKGLILIILLIELMTSMQNEQSNGLMAGLFVLGFALLENKKYFIATLCIVLSIYIKLFGIVAFSLFLLYPHKGKLTLYTVFWLVALFLLPLAFVDYDYYQGLFVSYLGLLTEDHAGSLGLSVMGWLSTWFHLDVNKNMVVLIGAIIFIVPLVKIKAYAAYDFRKLVLASVLIWVIIFNHRAESPTFVIAMAGVSIWFISSEKSWINKLLFILAFIFVSLSPTDIFPRFIRKEFVDPYVLKAVPCIFIWVKIIYDLIVFKPSLEENATVDLSA